MGRHQLDIIPMNIDYLPFVSSWTKDVPPDLIKWQIENASANKDQILLCLMDQTIPVGLMEIFSAAFTELHVPYTPEPGTWSCRLTVDPSIKENIELQTDIINAFLVFIFREKQASEILWELPQAEVQSHLLATLSGFSKVGQIERFVLYRVPDLAGT